MISKYHPTVNTEYTLTHIDHVKIGMAVSVTTHIDFGKTNLHTDMATGDTSFTTPSAARPLLSSASTIDNYHNTWESVIIRLDDFDHARPGRFTAGSFQDLCGSDLCTCRELCDGLLLSKRTISTTTRRVTSIPRQVNTTFFGRHAGTEIARPAADSRNSI